MDPSQLAGMSGGENAEAQAEAQQAQEQRRAALFQTLLTPEAYERLNRIAIVKESTAEAVKTNILSMYQRGVLSEKINDERLKQMLESIGGKESQKNTKIKFARKNYGQEESDEEYDL